MSLTVRFPTGLVVVYARANHCVGRDHDWELSEQVKDRLTWITSVPYSSGAIIESVRASWIDRTNTNDNPDNAGTYFLNHLKEVESLELLKRIKHALKRFNATTKTWESS